MILLLDSSTVLYLDFVLNIKNFTIIVLQNKVVIIFDIDAHTVYMNINVGSQNHL